MKSLRLFLIIYLFFGFIPNKNLVHAEVKNPKDFKVLANLKKKSSEQLSKVTGGLNLPFDLKLPF